MADATPFLDCLLKYGTISTEGAKVPEGAVLAPFVKLTFEASGAVITVGNLSSPHVENTAIIKSFEIGWTEHPRAKVVITDQKGASFSSFMENMIVDSRCYSPDKAYNVKAQWGWIGLMANDQIAPPKMSPVWTLYTNHVIANVTDSFCTFEIEFTDLMDRSTDFRIDKIYGSDDNKMFFTTAVRALMNEQDYPPNVATVAFLSRDASGKPQPLRFKEVDGNQTPVNDQNGRPLFDPQRGPRGVWRTNNLDKLNTLNEWCSEVLSADDKGIVALLDPQRDALVIMEDPPKDLKPAKDKANRTYIVNGGKDSPVISFNPHFKFQFNSALGSSGGVAGTESVNSNVETQSKSTGPNIDTLKRPENKNAGSEVSIPVKENKADTYGGTQAEKESQRAANEQMTAIGHSISSTESIRADLVIVGDPLMEPLEVKKSYVSIIQVNPFYIDSAYFLDPSTGGVTDWTVKPPCNEVVSNKNWLIEGFNHQIQDGRYTTTLNLFLPAPGVTLPADAPFGGSGWQPKPC